jgi:hypothetical protein
VIAAAAVEVLSLATVTAAVIAAVAAAVAVAAAAAVVAVVVRPECQIVRSTATNKRQIH